MWFLLVAATPAQSGSSDRWIIKNVNIVSPENKRVISNQDVIFSAAGIERIGPNLAVEKSKAIDGTGRYLIPGLIDGHVHLGSTGGIQPSLLESSQELQSEFHQQEPRSYLYFGFTTVVDLSQNESFAKSWESHALKPNLVYCKSLPFTNGYGMAFQPQEHRFKNPYFIYDPSQQNKIPESVKVEQHTPEAVIAKVMKTKASCIKTFHESGFGGLWNWPTPDNQTIARLKQLASANELIHFHHGINLTSQRQAVLAEVNVIAHGLWNWEALNHEQDLPPEIRKLLDQIIAKGIAYQPTIQVLVGELDLFNDDFLTQDLISHSLTPDLLAWHQKEGHDWFKQVMEKRIKSNPTVVANFLGHEPTGKAGETSSRALTRLQMVVDYLAKNGGRIVLGSDSPSSPTYTNPPGLNGYSELQKLHEMGLSLKQVLDAATRSNAQVLNLDHRIGKVAEGMQANLLVLKQNPWTDIKAYDSIEWVVMSGKPIPREALSARHFSD